MLALSPHFVAICFGCSVAIAVVDVVVIVGIVQPAVLGQHGRDSWCVALWRAFAVRKG